MSTIQVQIPDSLQKSLDDLAARDGISIDRKVQKGKSRKVSGNLNKSSRC